MKKEIHITKSQIFISLAIVALFMLLIPHIMREFNDSSTLMGDEPYYHARIAEQIREGGIPEEDTFVYGARPYVSNPYHLLLAGISSIFGVIFASKLIPFACGAISLALFYFILKNLGFSKLSRIMMFMAFMLSPVFIRSFTLSTPVCFILLLDLLGLYLFMQKGNKFFIISLFVFSAAAFFGAFNTLIIIFMTFAYSISCEGKKRRLYSLGFLLAAIFFFYHMDIYFKFGWPITEKIAGTNLAQQFITDFGGIFGFSIFALFLSILGLAIAWKYKKRLYPVYLIMIGVIIISFFYNPAVAYSNFIIAMLSGVALEALVKQKWELKLIRNLSIILLFCGLLFSAVSYSVRISSEHPNTELIEALDWIRQNSGDDELVFSHYNNGFWVQFQAERAVIIDSISDYSIDFDKRLEDSARIFESWDIKETRNLLEKYGADLVLVTADMQEGLVWDEPEQGLAYILRNNETFKKEYSNDYAVVWRYIYGEN